MIVNQRRQTGDVLVLHAVSLALNLRERRVPRNASGSMANVCSMVTSAEFQAVRRALLACSNADRAYLRRWILRWVDEQGRIRKDAEPLPDRGCS